VIQNAGLGTKVPDPSADPYCVRFDKTHQNITGLGIVDFLLKEPARTAAAVPKCFYFQEDHWRGTVSQGEETAVYEFQGHYFFNKATGDGGVWVTGFTVDGQTFDPTALPGFPPADGKYFGPGTGGFITHDDVPADPQCAALAKHHPGGVYPAPQTPRCVPGAGSVTRRGLGPLLLGARENAVRSELGPPSRIDRGFLHYCVSGGGSFLVGQPGDRSGTLGTGGREPTVMLMTTSRGFTLTGRRRHLLRVGARASAARRAFPHARRFLKVAGVQVLRARPGLLVGLRRGRVAYLVSYSPRQIRTRKPLASYLRRA
jgi:hypothetical protein